VNVTGTNFAAGEDVLIHFHDATYGTVPAITTDSGGGLSTSFVVPADTPSNTYTVTVTGEGGDSASADFTVTGLTVSGSYCSFPGQTATGETIYILLGFISVSGSGFVAGELVTNRFDGRLLGTLHASAQGSFGFDISSNYFPLVDPGSHTITATGASGATARANVTVPPC
jgi:hypothetical protein